MTTDEPAPLGTAEQLAATARALKAEVADLTGEVKSLRYRTVRAERRTALTAMFIAALLLGAVWLGVITFQTRRIAEQSQATAARLEHLTQRSLCPFYALILGSYAPDSRLLNPDGSYEGSPRQKYVDGFNGPDGMREQHDALGCTNELIPGRAGG